MESLPKELLEAKMACAKSGGFFRESEIGRDDSRERSPIVLFECGSQNPAAPALTVVAGVHGLERIGCWLAIDCMRWISERARWDKALLGALEGVCLRFIPAANPSGLQAGTRSNWAGVDLMRNAPQDAEARVPFLAGGHRLGPWLPWYRGPKGKPMQAEAMALVDDALACAKARPATIVLDCHSGYGFKDGLWFPSARSQAPFSDIARAMKLGEMLEGALPHHGYVLAPQSSQYLAHGDLWDFVHEKTKQENCGAMLPLTLEMGAWTWIRKNPMQALSLDGLFNPVKEHRQKRVLRRHAGLVDFLLSAALSWESWASVEDVEQARLEAAAKVAWWPDEIGWRSPVLHWEKP